MVKRAIFICLLLHSFVGGAIALPAFPGAEGIGAESIGGRGGAVIKVTNLDDSGAGSLREAVATTGPRIVVFEVSGIINLQTNLEITEPYITIAGQTSPGGICIAGRTTLVNTNDVVVQYLRFRTGSHNVVDTADASTLDTFQVWGDHLSGLNRAYNIVVDHCSFSWSIDETVAISYGVESVTFQYCSITEPLSLAGHEKTEHSKAFLVSGNDKPSYVTLHHSYISHANDRMPLVNGPFRSLLDARNNVVFDQKGTLGMQTQKACGANWIHNYIKPSERSNQYFEAVHWQDGGLVEQLIYAEGNIGMERTSQSDPEWAVGFDWQDVLLSTDFQKLTPWDLGGLPVTTTEMSTAYAAGILETVGASKPFRDSVDIRTIGDYASSTSGVKVDSAWPSDWPIFTTPAALTDTDNDGMSDVWETEEGFNVGADDSTLDADGDGYTNIEEYLHSLAAVVFVGPSISITTESQSTTNSSITITGITTPNATSGSAITSVTCDGQTATGTTSWSSTVPLDVGSNTFVFTVTDSAGENATASVTITRTVIPSGDTLTISGCTIQGVTIQ